MNLTNSDKGDRPDDVECSSKPARKKNGRSSEAIKEKWKEKKEYDKTRLQKTVPCPFRKFIGLDGCFLTHTCKGQLLTAIVDLELGYGGGLTLISDGRKGLLEAVAGILPDSEHRQYARHIYANFKRKWSGLQYKRLFWGAAPCTVDQQFLLKMGQIKELDPSAQKWLVERNLNSWCRAFVEIDICFVAFENGISESFNSRIVPARGKTIITMLEDIRIYIMQRMCHMNKVSFKLEDTVTISVRKRLKLLKEKQSWLVYPSGFREVEVRRGDYAYGVNLHTKQCGCRFWELSGIPCVHAMATYYHMNMEPELGVNEFLSKQSWYNAYQYSIRPVHGSKLWKPCDNPTPLPPIERKRPGRPRKQRIRHPTEDEHHVSRVGNTNVLARSSKKRGTIRIGSPIKKGEENQVTKGGSMDNGNLTAKEYQNKMDMEALAEFRDEELPGLEDSLDNAYSFDTISDFQDNELNVHQVYVDLPVNEAPENYTTEESQAEDPNPKPIVPTQESQIQTRSKIRKQVAATTSMRIFVKNKGRSERIAMIKAKKFKFDANGIRSTANKAFDVSEDEE
ncbi:zinc finger, PMZ-type containing protein [Tanacetum coccineum]